MTDLRVPERYLSNRQVMRLAAPDFMSFVMASLWSVSNRTDGQIDVDDLALIPRFDKASAGVLVESGLWLRHAGGWLIVDFERDQTSRSDLEVLENARAAEARKKRGQRARKKAETEAAARAIPGTVPGDASPGTAQDRTGQARTGQARTEEPVTTWLTTTPPDNSGAHCEICPALIGSDALTTICGAMDEAHSVARLPRAV